MISYFLVMTVDSEIRFIILSLLRLWIYLTMKREKEFMYFHEWRGSNEYVEFIILRVLQVAQNGCACARIIYYFVFIWFTWVLSQKWVPGGNQQDRAFFYI